MRSTTLTVHNGLESFLKEISNLQCCAFSQDVSTALEYTVWFYGRGLMNASYGNTGSRIFKWGVQN